MRTRVTRLAILFLEVTASRSVCMETLLQRAICGKSGKPAPIQHLESTTF